MENEIEKYITELELAESSGNDFEKQRIYTEIGIYYAEQDENREAYEYFLKSLEINEKIHDFYNVALLKLNIGGLFKNRKDYEKSREYFINALEIATNHGFKDIIEKAKKEIRKAYFQDPKIKMGHNLIILACILLFISYYINPGGFIRLISVIVIIYGIYLWLPRYIKMIRNKPK